MQPIHVHIHEIKKPNTPPNAKKLIVIKTNKGNGGIILSSIMKRDPRKGPYTPKASIVLIINS